LPNTIKPAVKSDAELLSRIASVALMESHGHSAREEDMNSYIKDKYSAAAFEEELTEEKNIYHLMYHEEQPAGYSKIILDHAFENSESQHVTKLERIYLLKEYYGLKLGWKLFEFNTALAKRHDQKGIWLHVWKENQRAINFYKKAGFRVIGHHDFRISATHTNPNHLMYMDF
jgi:ribosomal protein S18 acetylase RimI-like enzyme